MFHIPALTWTLTAVLLIAGSYHLAQAVRARHLTDRVNNTLHALMNTLMTAMLWNLGPSTLLAQIAILAGAALWFTLQAVARPEFKLLCAGNQGRLKCAYHSLTMAAAATMITLMTTHTPTAAATATGTGTTTTAAGTHTTHHGSAYTTTDTTTTAALGNTPAIALTLVFAAAATTFLILRHRTTTTTHHGRKHPTRTEHALEALGATTMALMFATMTT
ncbi:DUF5134 domain-containing protein [Arthrobacter sp. QXT-31]|uniref:DUF5134 domain-containing protein n=1 Tax=Arthrobacter sp. QXT-31 TaxID=1357915 RepID=UPI000971BC05|nr:DUF5134 domain-containing protein [Arthrobacter sp. QXT-31]APX01967.1 hypothetical protein BWQ92_09825 [Arthrobacter sp. QXT-31]